MPDKSAQPKRSQNDYTVYANEMTRLSDAAWLLPENARREVQLRVTNSHLYYDAARCTISASLNWVGRTVAAMVYFNPLWIACHLLIINVTSIAFSVGAKAVFSGLLSSGSISFFTNLPLTAAANYFIQVHVPVRWRFFASAALTAILTLKYAIEFRFFGRA